MPATGNRKCQCWPYPSPQAWSHAKKYQTQAHRRKLHCTAGRNVTAPNPIGWDVEEGSLQHTPTMISLLSRHPVPWASLPSRPHFVSHLLSLSCFHCQSLPPLPSNYESHTLFPFPPFLFLYIIPSSLHCVPQMDVCSTKSVPDAQTASSSAVYEIFALVFHQVHSLQQVPWDDVALLLLA